MPPARILPDDQPEVGYVYISLGLDAAGGPSVAIDYEGITATQAIGELYAAADMLRDEQRLGWREITDEEIV